MKGKFFVLIVGTAALAGLGAQAFGSSTAQQAHGHFVSHASPPPNCASVIGICRAGRFEGTINGDFVFTANRVEPSDTPGVVFITGEIVVDTQKGELTCQLAGVVKNTPSRGAVSICTIVGGTDDWAGVSGHIRTHGPVDQNDVGEIHYEGVISH